MIIIVRVIIIITLIKTTIVPYQGDLHFISNVFWNLHDTILGFIHLWRYDVYKKWPNFWPLSPSLHHPQKWATDQLLKNERIYKHVVNFKTSTPLPCERHKCMPPNTDGNVNSCSLTSCKNPLFSLFVFVEQFNCLYPSVMHFY